ncbi:co(2)-response secreted protease [Phtheirospermum japonicum]|uniref:Co(2)-response secreted protease n=1 Tax=Phtheirospermum japonicum TaxID=374723 RepID=A0A830CF40_9LAMI|nr:co(2)-response secreted protease [Phtheirospermum japonicum]
MKRKKDSVVYTYSNGFSGFAAHLSKEEAKSIAQRPEVVSVFRDPVLQLHTTRSKLIGARYYDNPEAPGYIGTARDEDGHGTHVASTAAGIPIWGASYKGLAKGIARGGSPGSRIAMYRVCGEDGCWGSAILKAFDDAISDGVDVLSVSFGGQHDDLLADPVAIGAFHAVEKGITVVCSVGNDGPSSGTVKNFVPWVLSVGSTTIDRDLESDLVLGGNRVIKGGGLNFSGLNKSAIYPLVDGRSASSNQTNVDDASNCVPGSLDDAKVRGNIVLCDYKDTHGISDKIDTLMKQGAVGIIMIHNRLRRFAFDFGTTPFISVTEEDGAHIRSYINSTR